MIFVSVRKTHGKDGPIISSMSKYSGIRRNGVDEIQIVKGTRFEYESNGLKVYEVLALRNGLDLNSNLVVDTDDEEMAKEAILSLLDS